jgi:UDP-N-acetylmuramoyl-L-alanyl-D-glutamate--2,6-diaminopimelate ligase
MILGMQELTRLKICTNFILKNSDGARYLSDRFCLDSRRINNNQIFISLEPDMEKSITNINHAISKGASGFITPLCITRQKIRSSIPFLIERGIKKIYVELFKADFEENERKPVIIGITGTNGKTSTTLLLAQSLTHQNKKVGVISSEGSGIYPKLEENEYTTPPIDICYKYQRFFSKKKCDYVIIECSSQGLHQGRLDGIHFTYSIITNIDQDHIEYHKSLKNYINSKLKIMNQCTTSIINFDCNNLKNIDHHKHGCKNIFYISQNKSKNKKIISIPQRENIKNLENFNIYSLLMIFALMRLEKFKTPTIFESINNLNPLDGRRQIFTTNKKGDFIVDYAHTVQAYKNIYLDFNINKKICTLFGCGGDRDKIKRKIISKIVDNYSSKIIITKDNSRSEQFKKILNDILKGIKNLDKVKIIKSRKNAIKYMVQTSSDDRLNFILGKGNEDFILENNKKIKHNDVIYLKNILKNYEYKTIKDC